MDTYSLYKIYVSLKLHFTDEPYDFLKYDGKISRISEKSLSKRNDYTIFGKVASLLPQKVAVPFLVSHFITLNMFTPSFILENPIKSQKIYSSWKERTGNMLEYYKEDLKVIAKEGNYSWKNCICQEDEDYPLLFKLVLSRRITPETYTLLNDLFQQTSHSYRGLENDTLFSSMNLKYKKYRSFLSPEIKDILRVTPKDLTIYKE